MPIGSVMSGATRRLLDDPDIELQRLAEPADALLEHLKAQTEDAGLVGSGEAKPNRPFAALLWTSRRGDSVLGGNDDPVAGALNSTVEYRHPN